MSPGTLCYPPPSDPEILSPGTLCYPPPPQVTRPVVCSGGLNAVGFVNAGNEAATYPQAIFDGEATLPDSNGRSEKRKRISSEYNIGTSGRAQVTGPLFVVLFHPFPQRSSPGQSRASAARNLRSILQSLETSQPFLNGATLGSRRFRGSRVPSMTLFIFFNLLRCIPVCTIISKVKKTHTREQDFCISARKPVKQNKH